MPALGGLDLIHSFVVVAEELSFRRSAERLNVDQSALSRRIQKLEQQLDFPLFERTTRDVSLTPAGHSFYKKNNQLLRDYAKSIDTAQQIAEGKAGRLNIAYTSMSAVAPMPQAVTAFEQKFPLVDIRLRFVNSLSQKIALANDEIDLAFMIGPLDHSEFRSIVLKSDPFCAVMPPGHPLAEKDELHPADLAEVDIVIGDMIDSEFYRGRLDDLFSKEGVSLQVRQEASTSLAVLGLVAAGLGITIFPKSLASFVSPKVELRQIVHPDFVNQTLLVWRNSNRTNTLRNFVEVAKSIHPR